MLADFAQLLYSLDDHIHPRHPVIALTFLFDLCGLLQCGSLQSRIVRSVDYRAPIEPWEVFKFAARTHNTLLARKAISHFGSSLDVLPNNLPKLVIEPEFPYPNSYGIELLRLRLVERSKSIVGEGDKVNSQELRPWNEVAEMFLVPIVRQIPPVHSVARGSIMDPGEDGWGDRLVARGPAGIK
jgi:hypothetical protein